MASDNSFAQPPDESVPFEQVRNLVESEFTVEDAFLAYGVPTFHVTLQKDSKEAFLRLAQHLDPLGFIPVVRERDEKTVLQVRVKPSAKSSRKLINVALLFATLGTVFFAGYWQWGVTSALMFTGAIMAILGSHEMGHKLAADRHNVEATYPYFIPGPPPIGTFGAVIQQKSLPPNRDALFDIGSTGPVIGFIVAVIITVIGFPLSTYDWIPPDSPTLPASVLFWLISRFFPPAATPPPQTDPTTIPAILLHPVAFAGWVGMIVTVLNLIPVGMFDGGHIARTFLGKRTRTILSYATIGILLVLGFLGWTPFIIWAIMAIFFSSMRHPGPLDDLSKVTTWRKIAALGMVTVFFLSFPFLI